MNPEPLTGIFIEAIDGLRLGAPLADADIRRLGLRASVADADDEPHWRDEADLLTVFVDDGKIELLSTARDADGLGDLRIGSPCEEVAVLVAPPSSFHPITGEWIYHDDKRELTLGFWDGRLSWLTLSLT